MKNLLLIGVCFLVLLSFASAEMSVGGFAPTNPKAMDVWAFYPGEGGFVPIQPEIMVVGGFAPVQPLMGGGSDGSSLVKGLITPVIAGPIEEDSGM